MLVVMPMKYRRELHISINEEMPVNDHIIVGYILGFMLLANLVIFGFLSPILYIEGNVSSAKVAAIFALISFFALLSQSSFASFVKCIREKWPSLYQLIDRPPMYPNLHNESLRQINFLFSKLPKAEIYPRSIILWHYFNRTIFSLFIFTGIGGGAFMYFNLKA